MDQEYNFINISVRDTGHIGTPERIYGNRAPRLLTTHSTCLCSSQGSLGMLALLISAPAKTPAVDGISDHWISKLYPHLPNGALDHTFIIMVVPFPICAQLHGDF